MPLSGVVAVEQARIMAPARVSSCDVSARAKCGDVGEAREAGDMGEVVRRFRQRVGLLVLDHLQAMFEPAQEAIGRP